ncbi:MAG: DeoR family transcriptional regulator [Rhodovulum sulfidophilum]|uniref:DeoR family transcriptional regulator n=1 Tax=Rhodovulum sulfidophilum TaxID=35806 RepID=A0A2W5NC59_RHOSU|nr:MAG: DeoR family transcriptional regulator [Rhodovulum sulfidophilum]
MSSLLTSERLDAIESRLLREGRVVAAELARDFETSEDTIRRDLRALAAAGRCRRVYGGALPATPSRGPNSSRAQLAADAKQALGAALARLVLPGMTVFLDAGTTNLATARALAASADLGGVTLVTHAPAIAAALVEARGASLVAIGGRVDPEIGAAIGARALEEIATLRPDLLLLGTCGLDPDGALTAHSVEDGVVKRRLAANSGAVATACDRGKIGTAGPVSVIELAACDTLVIEAGLAPSVRERLASLGPELIEVETGA